MCLLLTLVLASGFTTSVCAQNAFQRFIKKLEEPTAEERRRAQASGKAVRQPVKRADDDDETETEQKPSPPKRSRRSPAKPDQKPRPADRKDETAKSAKPTSPEKAPVKATREAAKPSAKERVPFRREGEPDTGPIPPPERSPVTAGKSFVPEEPPPPMPVRNPVASERPRPVPEVADRTPAPDDLRVTEWPRTPGQKPTPPLPTRGKRGQETAEAEKLRREQELERAEQEKAELEMIEAEQRRLERERERAEQEKAELEMIAREEAEMARAGIEKAGPERPGPGGWTPETVAAAKERCAQLLAHVAIKYKFQPAIRQGSCGAPAPILVSSIGSDPAIEISPPAVINCTLASGLDRWIKQAVQPNARVYLGSPIVRVRNAAAYDCRGRNGSRSGKLSEHAFANALDIGVFETASGGSVTVLTEWPKMLGRGPAYGPLRRGVVPAANAEEMPPDRKAAFLVSTHRSACPIFGTVLGPAADAAHRSHFHVDMAKRRRSSFCE